jgi:hypothetical protein
MAISETKTKVFFAADFALMNTDQNPKSLLPLRATEDTEEKRRKRQVSN